MTTTGGYLVKKVWDIFWQIPQRLCTLFPSFNIGYMCDDFVLVCVEFRVIQFTSSRYKAEHLCYRLSFSVLFVLPRVKEYSGERLSSVTTLLTFLAPSWTHPHVCALSCDLIPQAGLCARVLPYNLMQCAIWQTVSASPQGMTNEINRKALSFIPFCGVKPIDGVMLFRWSRNQQLINFGVPWCYLLTEKLYISYKTPWYSFVQRQKIFWK